MKKVLWLISAIILSGSPLYAEVYDAQACDHIRGDCYNATVDMKYKTVVIEFDAENHLELDLDDSYPEDLTTYDYQNDTYYDIELLK
jgi:hypothetical protein